MDLDIFGMQYNKAVADAIKVGAFDSKTDSVLKDLIKTMGSEIKKKEDMIQRSVGEVVQLKSMHNIILALVKNHTRVEQANIDAEEDRKRLLAETTEEKKAKLAPKKKVKKVAKKTGKKSVSTFVGDSSK